MSLFDRPALTILLVVVVVPAVAGIAWVTSQDETTAPPLRNVPATAHAPTNTSIPTYSASNRPATGERRTMAFNGALNGGAGLAPESQHAGFQNSASPQPASPYRAVADKPRGELAAPSHAAGDTGRTSSSSSSFRTASAGPDSPASSEPEKKSTQTQTTDTSVCIDHTESRTDPNTGQSWTKVWYCNNDRHAAMYAGTNNSTLVAYMEPANNWFTCYRQGEEHQGGNNVWYYGQGDLWAGTAAVRQGWGYVPAVNVRTGGDPYSGMPPCAPDMWQSKLTVTDPNTGKTWSTVWFGGNNSNVPMYKDPNSTDLIGFMDTTTSWYVCYARGAVHGGGNNVWYYTQGDRAAPGWQSRHAWGFLPAQYMWTRKDPYDGIPLCDF